MRFSVSWIICPFAIVLPAVAVAQTPYHQITTSGPLSAIVLGNEGSDRIEHAGADRVGLIARLLIPLRRRIR